MATLHIFKLLATQCGVVQSPTRSPRTSPIVVLRCRKTTLRLLLNRSSSRRSPRCRALSLRPRLLDKITDSRKDAGRSLRDLFVPSPPFQGGDSAADAAEEKGEFKIGEGYDGSSMGPGSPMPGWIRFRIRSSLRKRRQRREQSRVSGNSRCRWCRAVKGELAPVSMEFRGWDRRQRRGEMEAGHGSDPGTVVVPVGAERDGEPFPHGGSFLQARAVQQPRQGI